MPKGDLLQTSQEPFYNGAILADKRGDITNGTK